MMPMRYEVGYIRPDQSHAIEGYAQDFALAESMADALYEQERQLDSMTGMKSTLRPYIYDLEGADPGNNLYGA